jgi:adenylosuccinate lyase
MRKYGVSEPYEKIKRLTRGKTLDETNIKKIIQGLDLPAELKRQLLALRPESYTGKASKLVERLIKK